jgi:hypothetical protein
MLPFLSRLISHLISALSTRRSRRWFVPLAMAIVIGLVLINLWHPAAPPPTALGDRPAATASANAPAPANAPTAAPASSPLALPAQSPIPLRTAKASPFQPLGPISAKAQRVTVGFYPMNVYGVDISSNTYYIDTYIWFKWKGKIDPIADLEFTNAVEDWSMTQKPGYEKPQLQPDGSLYQILRMEGRFFQPYNLAKFPLDRQQLGILIENSIYTAQQLVYLADTQDTGYSPTVSVQGWQVMGWQTHNLLHTYPSNFGLAVPELTPYSALRYEMHVERPLNYFIWKLLLPLIIVLVSSLGAFLLHPSYVESRIAIPVSALLTIVFLQQSYSAALPEVGYLVLLDQIYALSYLLVIAAILETIITADWVKSKQPADIARAQRLDRPFLILQCGVLCVGIPVLCWL